MIHSLLMILFLPTAILCLLLLKVAMASIILLANHSIRMPRLTGALLVMRLTTIRIKRTSCLKMLNRWWVVRVIIIYSVMMRRVTGLYRVLLLA